MRLALVDIRFLRPEIQELREQPTLKLQVKNWLSLSTEDKRHLIRLSGGPSWCDSSGTRTFGFIYRGKMDSFARAVRQVYELPAEEVEYARKHD